MRHNRLTDTSSWGCDMQGRDRLRRSGVTRRGFLRNGALALVGTSVIPAFLTRSVLAQGLSSNGARKKLVVIFQRGACDGLNVLVPHAEPNYYAMRPTIAIPQTDLLDLDGFFGLHPAMASLRPMWSSRHLAAVHAAGSPDPTRSHFDAQDYMESGTPGVKSTTTGWLNRALSDSQGRSQSASPFRAVALSSQVPRTLAGPAPAVALTSLKDFSVGSHAEEASPVANAFQSMYDESSDTVLHGTGQETFEAIRMLRSADPARYKPADGVNYPGSAFGNSMRQIAQLMKANLGVEAAFADVGGWDTHNNQGASTGQLANRLRDFADSLSAFWQDMGDDAEHVTVVTMSEFGRTAHQNGTGGTDHGHANVMFVLGGNVQGGKVYGEWPGLAPEQLNEGRDLKVTTDFRRVLTETVQQTIGLPHQNVVFPNSKLGQGSVLHFV